MPGWSVPLRSVLPALRVHPGHADSVDWHGAGHTNAPLRAFCGPLSRGTSPGIAITSYTETEVSNVLLNVLAEGGAQQTGGFNFINLLLPLALVVLIFLMFRKQRTAAKNVQQQRTQMVPGTAVMTNFGLFGTIVSIDADQNKAVLELSPGNTATVHMQALTKVVDATDAQSQGDSARYQAGTSDAIPDDASSLTDNSASTGHSAVADHPASNGNTDADGPETDFRSETPAETAARLNRDSTNKDN